MKNDILVALMALILSASIAWMSSLTVMVFKLDKAHAVQVVREEEWHKMEVKK